MGLSNNTVTFVWIADFYLHCTCVFRAGYSRGGRDNYQLNFCQNEKVSIPAAVSDQLS